MPHNDFLRPALKLSLSRTPVRVAKDRSESPRTVPAPGVEARRAERRVAAACAGPRDMASGETARCAANCKQPSTADVGIKFLSFQWVIFPGNNC